MSKIYPLFTWRSAVVESDVSPAARHVALTLTMHMNERGDSAMPSLATLQRETGRGRTTILNALTELEEAGLLEVKRGSQGRGKTNRYRAVVTDEHVERFLSTRPKLAAKVRPQDLSTGEKVLRATRKGPESAPEDVVRKDVTTSAAKERPRNIVWDALTKHFGEPATPSEKTNRGKTVRELRATGLTDEQIVVGIDQRLAAYWEGLDKTETALRTHWTLLGSRRAEGQENLPHLRRCPECGGSGTLPPEATGFPTEVKCDTCKGEGTV